MSESAVEQEGAQSADEPLPSLNIPTPAPWQETKNPDRPRTFCRMCGKLRKCKQVKSGRATKWQCQNGCNVAE